MTVTQTVDIPADRHVILPPEVPTGKVILTFTPAPAELVPAEPLHPCPICARNIDPETGNPRWGPKTSAAIDEGIAVSRGEIPAKRFSSLDEMWEDLMRDDPEDELSDDEDDI